jgi:PAS domain S-box-containing protein
MDMRVPAAPRSIALEVPMHEAWAAVFQCLPDAAFIIDGGDDEGAIQQLNHQAVLMFGYDRDELIGQSIDVLLPEHLRHRYAQHRVAHAAAPRSRQMGAGHELTGRRRDGSEFPIDVMLNTTVNGDAKTTIAIVRDLTLRVQLQDALDLSESRLRDSRARASHARAQQLIEARLRSVFRALADGVTVQTNTGAIVDANAAAESILGLTREQLLGRASLDPEWQSVRADGSPFPGIDHPSMVTLRTGLPLRNQIMGVQVPGRGLRWLTINSQPIANDGASSSVAVVTTFTDVTTIRGLEEQVATEAARIRLYLRNASDGVHIQDAAGRLIEVSDSFCRMLGYEAHELIGQLPSLWDARLSGQEFDTTLAALLGGTVSRFDTLHRRKDGSVFPVEVHVEDFEVDGHRYLFCSSRDMTERNRVEAALRSSENKSRLLFDAAVDASYLSTVEDGVILEVNDAWLSLFGYSRAEVIGSTLRQLGIDPDDVVRNGFGRRPESRAFAGFDVTFATRSGAPVIGRISSVEVSIEGKDHRLVTVRDVTLQRKLERAVLESATAEQQKLGHDLHDGLGQELTGISMMAVALSSTLRAQGLAAASEGDRISALLQKATQHCRAIAHGLSPLHYVGGNLREALAESIALVRESYRVDARLHYTQSAPLTLDVDALDNLYCIAKEAITNARRHGRCTLLSVRLEVGPHVVRLVVEDNGIGMTAVAVPSTGMGLKVMGFRADAIGAQLSIGPGARGGVRVAVECRQRA